MQKILIVEDDESIARMLEATLEMAKYECRICCDGSLAPEEIRGEAALLLQERRAPGTPNSPHGTHCMARVSPDFLARSGTQAHDQLMTLLPFRSLAITGMKELPGTYVTILASEDRSKELRQRRPSVRRQLKQEPRPAEKPEKKSPIHKKKEPER